MKLLLLLLPILAYTSNDFWVTADFLYWQADEDGLEYAVSAEFSGDERNNGPEKYTKQDLDFDWNPGFRANMGYLWENKTCWDIEGIWTHIRNTASGKKVSNNVFTNPIFANWFGGQLATGSKVTSHLAILLNTADLQIGRGTLSSQALELHPFAGVRGAWIEQNYKITSTGNEELIRGYCSEATNGVVYTFPPSGLSMQHNFAGIGLRMGLDMQWNAFSHWKVLGQISGSLLEAYTHVHQKFKTATNSSNILGNTATPNVSYQHEGWRNCTNIETAVGIEWHAKHISISILYEASEWFAQNQLAAILGSVIGGVDSIPLLYIDPREGNLSFQGLTLQGKWDF